MSYRPWSIMLAVAVALVAVVGLSCSDLLSPRWALLADDLGQLGAAFAATTACWVAAARHTGGQRRWRLWMGAGTCGWMIGQGVWTWYRQFAGIGLPSPSAADAGYLTLPVFALGAIIALAADRSAAGVPGRSGGRLVTVLDGIMVTGALFVITWATVLGPVVRTGANTRLAYSVAIAYPVTDLLLTVIVILLIGASAAANRWQLIILGAGLFGLSVSDSLFAYFVSAGTGSIPTVADAGFVVGLALVALAALTPTGPGPGWVMRPVVRPGHLLLPYVPVAAMVVLFVVQHAGGLPIDPVQVAVETMVVGILIVRQGITLLQAAKLVGSRARLVIATDRTRRQLERDLHDGIQQRLLSIALDVRRAEGHVSPGQDELRRQLGAVAAELHASVEEVRELSRGVHPAMLTEGGLRPALRNLARRSAVPVRLDLRLDGRLPEPVEVAAYYVAAEALTNVAKYAQATHVDVEVEVQRNRLRLAVHDDGVGGADPKRGTGLTGLADRVEALSGTLTVDSPAGHGTRLQADLPLT
ncbi:sensor histidine kinase [Dactylosporangium sp. CA-139066]|uniref:sensor histidine kinase n=1 Tax=Dactylosporangium sp. CA-139066 TaxID=3239930 RepID=UPI003D8B9DEE